MNTKQKEDSYECEICQEVGADSVLVIEGAMKFSRKVHAECVKNFSPFFSLASVPIGDIDPALL